MQLDKDTLVKHHFWIGAGLAVVLSLVFIFVVRSASEKSAKAKKEYDDAQAALNRQHRFVNEQFITPWQNLQKEYAKKKSNKWRREWTRQYYFNGRHLENGLNAAAILGDKPGAAPQSTLDDNGNDTDTEEKDNFTFRTFPPDNRNTPRGSRDRFRVAAFGSSVFGNDSQSESKYLNEAFRSLYLSQFPDYFDDYFKSLLDKSGDARKSDLLAKVSRETLSGDDLAKLLTPTLVNRLGRAQPMLSSTQVSNLRFEVKFQGGILGIFDPVDFPPPPTTPRPTMEEVWLAQEDFWLRRELLWTLYRAYNEIAELKPILNADGKNEWSVTDTDAPKEQTGEPFPVCRKFHNRTWELRLHVVRQTDGDKKVVISEKSTIHNVSPNKQPQAIYVNKDERVKFMLRQRFPVKVNGKDPWGRPVDGFRYEELEIVPKENVPVEWGGKGIPFGKDVVLDGEIRPNLDFRVREIFTEANSPMKSILAMHVASAEAQSHRTAAYALQLGPASPKPKPAAAPEATAADQAGVGVENPENPEGGQPGGVAAAPKVEKLAPVTDNKIPRYRYLTANEQHRKIPVAFAIVIDEAFKEEVLAAAINSRLNLQITQVHWRHVHSAFPEGRKEDRPGFPTQPGFPREGGDRTLPPDPSGRNVPDTSGRAPEDPLRGAPNTDTKDKPTTTRQTDESLIELAIYGIVDVYDVYRQPPAPKKEQAEPNAVP